MFETLKQRRMEKQRREALSNIRRERAAFEKMMQRSQIAGQQPDESVKDILRRFETIEEKASQASKEELDNLFDEAESLSELRAYLCPASEVSTDGRLSIDLMEEWGVPGTRI